MTDPNRLASTGTNVITVVAVALGIAVLGLAALVLAKKGKRKIVAL